MFMTIPQLQEQTPYQEQQQTPLKFLNIAAHKNNYEFDASFVIIQSVHNQWDPRHPVFSHRGISRRQSTGLLSTDSRHSVRLSC